MEAQNNLVFMTPSQAPKTFLTPDVFHSFTVSLTFSSTLYETTYFPSDINFVFGQYHPAAYLFPLTTKLGHFFSFLFITNSNNHHSEGITGQTLMLFNYLIQFKDKSDNLLNT